VPIVPLPIFEQDADPSRRDAMTDEEIYARLKPPTSIVVKYGSMRQVGEFPYAGDAKPGCGSRLVVRTPRGTEIAEMLTTTCGNGGCSKSVSRSEMLKFIENSGGRDYPFTQEGEILRLAAPEDLSRWSAIQSAAKDRRDHARAIAAELALDIKVIEVEAILGGECVTMLWMAPETHPEGAPRPDVSAAVQRLERHYGVRVIDRQIGARDEARLTADYEKCGQHCCCKNFLKVLKPVSMKSAKVQKATLDPLKISGRCGRLMCCLRYEDKTYEELSKRLPKKNSRVMTADGPGTVIDGKILVQLVLVRLDADRSEAAYPLEELLPGAVPN
jgi:cell fate regulator YaaT (PSP1 superfamily)